MTKSVHDINKVIDIIANKSDGIYTPRDVSKFILDQIEEYYGTDFVKEMREIFRQPTEEEIDDMYQQHLRDQAKASYNGQVPFKDDCNLDVDMKNKVHCMMVGTPGHDCA